MSFYPKEVAVTRLPVPARVARKRRQRNRRIATVAVLAVALVGFFAARSWAWDVLPGDAKRTCTTLTISTVIPDADWFSGTATLTFKGAADSRNSPGPLSVTVPFDNSEPAGTASGQVTWSDSSEVEPVSASYGAAEGCQEETTTTTTTTTVAPPAKETPPKEEKKDDFAGTATDQSRTLPPDTPEEVAPPVIKTPGTLPFTGPKEDMQRAMLLGGLALVLAGVALLVTLRRKPAVAVEQGWGETRVRPDRDSADANLLATLFSRRDR